MTTCAAVLAQAWTLLTFSYISPDNFGPSEFAYGLFQSVTSGAARGWVLEG